MSNLSVAVDGSIAAGNTGTDVAAEVTATKRLRIQQDGSQVFYEAWDSSVLDAINWNSVTVGNTGTSTLATGTLSLFSGTTAGGFAYITSKQNFQPVSPGFLEFDHQIQIGTTVISHQYAYWGAGTVPGSPTFASPLTNSIAFEVTNTGTFNAVTFASGNRTVISNLTALADTRVHRYQIFFRGDTMYWLVDNITVATLTTGAQGPDSNLLPLMMLVGTDGTGAASTTSLQGAAHYIGDTSKAGNWLSDKVHPQIGATVKLGTTQPLASDSPLVVALSPNSVAVSVMPNATTVTPTLATTTAYTATQVIGGILTFTGVLGAYNAGIVQSITAKFRAEASTTALSISLFKANPSVGTYTDHIASASNTADIANLLGTYRTGTGLGDLGTMTVYNIDNINKAVAAATSNLYAVVTSLGTTAAMASTSDFSMEMVVLPS